MDFGAITIGLTITAVLLVALGAAIFFANGKDKSNVAFALFSIGLCAWTLTMIGFREARQYDAAILWMKAAYAIAFFCGVSFWFFTKILDGKAIYRKSSIILHATLLILYAAAIMGTDLIVRSWSYLPDQTKTVTVSGFGWGMYAVYFLSYFAVGNLTLLKIYRRSSGKLKQQMRWLVVGVFVGGQIFGVSFNLILPSPIFNEWHYIWTGPLLTALFIVPLITYGIVRHQLLNVKIIAAETLVFAMILLSLLNLFSAENRQDIFFSGMTFFGMTVFGIFLIRSVFDEVKRREEIQRLATELAVSNKRLRQLDDLKTTMVSIASHQIRGPLGGMRGYLTMFRDGDLGALTDRQRDIVAMNLNVLTRLLNAVETFLDITRIESGKMMLKKEVLPLDDAVADVVREFEIPMQKKGIVLEFSVAAPRPVWVEFDPEKIKHVIFNLIDNAMKYTEQGRIDVVVRTEDESALLEISDTGMGIPPEDVHRLFGKYERGELVVDRGGSGLGLYVVKMLTEMQGGRVWVSSPGPGKGSVFTVSLPLARHV